jgi:uncharacterized membrane protein
MSTGEFVYDIPSFLIAAALLVLILAAIRVGIRIGDAKRRAQNEETKNQANAVQGSLLGLLALIIGFTFAIALARHDHRSGEVVNEANAIGTAWLRTDLVTDPRREEAKTLLRRYAALRLEASSVSMVDDGMRERLVAEAKSVFAALWDLAAAEARAAPNPATMGFASSLNDMIDALALRDAAVKRHVPEIALFILFSTFILLGGVVGYSAAIAGVRPGMPAHALVVLIVLLVFLIIDLDRPRRGLVEVDQSDLKTTVEAMQVR